MPCHCFISPLHPSLMPTVAIVGRPNVGKSALFNRLAGRKIAIVHDQPGVTRDRIAAPSAATQVPCTLIDTGGIGGGIEDGFDEQVSIEADIAMQTADLILFVVDAHSGLTPVDQALAQKLRKAKPPVLLVINKVDDEQHGRLGLAELLRERLIDRGEAVVGIDHEEDEVGGLHRDVGLDGDLFVEAILNPAADAAGVDEGARDLRGLGRGRDAVAGDARLVVDNGDLPPGKAVEESGLSDIRASNDGNSRHGGGM